MLGRLLPSSQQRTGLLHRRRRSRERVRVQTSRGMRKKEKKGLRLALSAPYFARLPTQIHFIPMIVGITREKGNPFVWIVLEKQTKREKKEKTNNTQPRTLKHKKTRNI